MDPRIERAIAERAQTQLGLITTDQLAAVGVHRSTTHRRIAGGLWVPVGRRTLRLAGVPTGPEVAVLAACLDLGAVASHRTAAWLHGLLPWTPIIDVTVVKGRATKAFPSLEDVRVHTSTNLSSEDVTRVGAVPVTSVARTLMGLAALSEAELPQHRLADLRVLLREERAEVAPDHATDHLVGGHVGGLGVVDDGAV